MNLTEIKQAVREGKTVHWASTGYVVKLSVKNDVEYWSIVCTWNNNCVSLTGSDDTKLEGKEEDFFISDDKENA
jgi:hypothetical protein